jgi:DNA-binding transcriptional LysR family regulator
MELRQLEYFVAVAEEGNFTRAAERVHISQSGVSAQIQQLERDLGAALIDRSGRTATLTPAGSAALSHARAALSAAADVRHAVDDVNDLVRGRLVVGMVTACTVTPLFDALAAFHGAHPGVGLTLAEDNSDRLVQRVRDGEMDLALVGVAGEPPAGLEYLIIISEGLRAIVPAGHPLGTRRTTTLRALVKYPIICLPEGTGVRTVYDRECIAHHRTPIVALQASAPDAVVDLARRGMGVAVLSETMAAHYDLASIPIRDIETPALLALAWARSPSPALRELLTHVREAFTPPPHPQPKRFSTRPSR